MADPEKLRPEGGGRRGVAWASRQFPARGAGQGSSEESQGPGLE